MAWTKYWKGNRGLPPPPLLGLLSSFPLFWPKRKYSSSSISKGLVNHGHTHKYILVTVCSKSMTRPGWLLCWIFEYVYALTVAVHKWRHHLQAEGGCQIIMTDDDQGVVSQMMTKAKKALSVCKQSCQMMTGGGGGYISQLMMTVDDPGMVTSIMNVLQFLDPLLLACEQACSSSPFLWKAPHVCFNCSFFLYCICVYFPLIIHKRNTCIHAKSIRVVYTFPWKWNGRKSAIYARPPLWRSR